MGCDHMSGLGQVAKDKLSYRSRANALWRSLHGVLAALSVFMALPAVSAWALDPVAASTVPVAIQQARRAMLSADVNTLFFHNMDELFTTRVVGRSGQVWTLPRRDAKPDFQYEFMGKKYGIDEFLDRNYTNALIIIKDGQIVHEDYRNNTNEDTRFISWSMSKSITSIMIGFLVKENKIKSLDDKIKKYIPELSNGSYKEASIRNIMEMRSGVDYEERYDFKNPGIAARNHESSLVKNVTRFADAANTIKSAAQPGTVFAYKTLDTAVLGWLVERQSGMSFAHYMSSRLWEPLGAERDGFYIMDGAPGVGREFTGAGYNATLRDFARIGLMMLNNGSANGHQIVSPDWVKASTVPAHPEGERGGYAFQWWTMANSDAYYAGGLQGQFIYIDPATHTVIAKLSYFPPEQESPYQEALAFMSAASAWKPW